MIYFNQARDKNTGQKMIMKHQAFIKETKGFSKSTCDSYLNLLSQLEAFCHTRNLALTEVNPETIEAFLNSMDISQNSRYNYLCSLRQFYQYLIYNECIAHNPAKEIKSPERVLKNHQTYTVEDVVRLINTESKNTPISVRNRTILELYYSTGLRCTELVNIKLFDVDLDNRLLKVFGKGSKERLIPLNDLAVYALNNYLSYRPYLMERNSQSAYLFTSKKSKKNPLTRQWCWRLVKLAAEKAGLGKDFTVHTLRHCFATHMLNNGANLRVVQDLLGHSTIQTTQIYTHLKNDQLKAHHREHHPRAR